ncbi:MAG: hypothetical protein E6J28_10910 [Chloroflexi bacterium]|nr:MAG: hypothetical protein E6J28_10910 [Chloroflexota bacterium]
MINRIWKLRHLRVAGLAAGVVAVAGAAVVVTASASGMGFGLRPSNAAQSNNAELAAVEASSSSAVCSNFMKHFAVEISKSQAEINSAFQRAIADTLADEVKSGQITQAQADAIKQKLANQTPCALPSAVGRPGGDKALGAYLQQYLTAAASALGVSESELKTDLKNGQSLSQVAAAKKVSEADFRSKVIANLKPVLDKAVADKKITSTQEQAIITRLQSGPLPLWNAHAKRPKPAASPSTATT